MKYTKGLLVIVALALAAVVFTSVVLYNSIAAKRLAYAASHPQVECGK